MSGEGADDSCLKKRRRKDVRMKKIINGKVYNTETATWIASYSNGLGRSDFAYCLEEMYKTRKGSYFIYGEGGGLSRWAKPCGDGTTGGEGIVAVRESEALYWLERHEETEVIEKLFSHILEEA